MSVFVPPPAHHAKVRAESWSNLSVLRHGRFDGVLVTSKNSGTHWLKYMLAVAIAETHNVPPPAYFSEAAVQPYIGGPKVVTAFAGFPKIASCHTIPHRLADWTWARRAARLPPYVLAVRHPMEVLASHYAKWAYDYAVSWEEYLEGDPSGRRFRCDLFWLARFWNRWGDLEARLGDRILRVTYEEMLAGTRRVIEAIARHWDIRLGSAAIDVAIAAGTKEAMALRIDPKGEPNVLQHRQTSIGEQFSGRAHDIYAGRVAALFRHDLGYDLMRAPEVARSPRQSRVMPGR